MDLKIQSKMVEIPLFCGKQIDVTPLGETTEAKKHLFLINCEIPVNRENPAVAYKNMQYVLRMEDNQNKTKRELESWLLLTKNNLSFYRPAIYYIDPNFEFSISEFYEGYTSIDKLDLSAIDKEVIAKYLLGLCQDYHQIKREDINAKAVIKKELKYFFEQGIERKLLQEEDLRTVIKFIDQTEFAAVATYNHCALSMENILYNKETQKTKIIHMECSKFTDPGYDYIYMIKNLDREISHIFMPMIENYDPKVVQVLSLLCDLRLLLDKGKQSRLESIFSQIENMKAQLTILRK